MDLATVGIRVDGNGAIVDLDRFAGAANRADRAGTRAEHMAMRLRAALAGLGLGLGLRELGQYADSWTLIGGRIGLVTSETRIATGVHAELFGVAQRARAQFEGVAALYTKVARNSKELGASQREVIQFTEAVSKGFITSGASVGEMNSAVIQLGQGLASGRLQGDELRSILENAPRLAEAIAKGLGVTIGKLRELGRDGKLTSQAVFRAVLSQREEIEREFARMPMTIGQSFTVLGNEVQRYIGQADAATGASRLVSHAVVGLSKHIDLMVKALGAAVLLWASYTVVLKANAAFTVVAAATQAALAAKTASAAVATSTLIHRVSVLGGEFLPLSATAVGASRAIGGVAASSSVAAVATTTLAVAARGLASALMGPLGIAILLATAVGGMVAYKSATLQAAAANNEFTASLAGMGKLELLGLQSDLAMQTFHSDRRLAELRAEGREVTRGLEHAAVVVGRLLVDAEARRGRGMFERGPSLEFEREAANNAQLRQRSGLLRQQLQLMAELDIRTQATTNTTNERTAAEKRRDRAIQEVLNSLKQLLGAGQQELELAALQGAAQAELQVQLQAGNDLLRLRGDLQEKVTSETITAADARRLAGEAERAYAASIALRIGAMQLLAKLEAEQRAGDAGRDLQQRMELTHRYGLAQQALGLHFIAVNRAIAARRDLTGEALRVTLQAIEAEERMGKELLVLERISQDLGTAFNDTFQNILRNGIKSFSDLFDAVREMLLRFMAEIATDQFLNGFGRRITEYLKRTFNPTGVPLSGVAATGGMPPATAARNAGLPEGDQRGGPQGQGQAASGALEGLVATTKVPQNQLRKLVGMLSNAVVGASLGYMFGQSSGSSVVGALGGAAGGAASGFAMGGPVGAVIGGVAGLAGGILGANKRQQEEARLLREALNRNSNRLAELRESVNGSPLLSGRNLAAAIPFAQAAGGMAGGGGLAGLVRAFGLASALRGGESSKALQQLERQFGLTAQQLGRMAQSMGIELFDSKGKLIPQALRQFAEALQLSVKAATTFTNSLDDIRLMQDARRRLFNLDTPQQQLRDVYEQLERLAPDLMKQMGLANLNLDTEAGRNVLLKGLQDIFTLITSGQLTPELLGAFTDKGQLIEALLGAKNGLDAFKTSLGDVTSDFPKAMDVVLYEMARGTGTAQPTGAQPPLPAAPTSSPPPPPTPSGGAPGTPGHGLTVNGGVTIISYGHETGEELLNKIEQAAAERAGLGGRTVLKGTVTA